MTQAAKLLHTAKTHTSGGRHDGISRSSDGRLDVKLSPPGGAGIGTNSAQLFAASWSACFEGAMETAARKRKIVLPGKSAIDAEIDLLEEGAYVLRARLNVSLPVSIARSRAASSMRRIRPAPIPTPCAATSTSRSH